MYEDLDRPPLRADALTRALLADGWRVEVLPTAGSTNALLAERARGGEPAGLVLVAEEQTAGRGRLDRSWVAPPRAGLTFSVLLQPALPVAQWPWLPLLTGLAVTRVLREQAGVDAVLKWPNDVLVGGRKLCGLLAEVPVPGLVVMGIGLNVTTRREELPHDLATSLVLEGSAVLDRDLLLRAVLRELGRVLAGDPAGDPAGDLVEGQAAYRALCSSLGARVRVELPGGATVEGTAEAVDTDGRLVVDGTPYGAGDVVHLRPA